MLQPRRWPRSEPLDEVFLRHYDQMVARAQQLVGRDRQAAEDLVHDTYVRVALRDRDASAIENVEGYLFTTLRNVHLSQVRRQTLKVRETSILDFDSAVAGLRSLPRGDGRQAACDALVDVVRYACTRKATSKAASILILRFFHGYYPVEIARLLRSSETAVAMRLRMARAEARVFVTTPSRLRSFGERRGPLCFAANEPQDTDFALALRNAIFDARTGVCLSSDEVDRLYAAGTPEPLDVLALSHLVCCPRCLDLVNRRLGLPLLADRDPSERLGRGGPSSGRGGPGAGTADPMSLVGIQLQDAQEDYPQELHIAVNGLFVGSQAINGPASEQCVKVPLTEQVGFIEVFDELGTCLLYLEVEPPPFGAVEQSATVALSNERRLSAALRFSEAMPTVHVVYEDPAATMAPQTPLERIERTAADAPSGRRWSFWPLAFRFAIAGIVLAMLLANPKQTLAAVERMGRVIVESITQVLERVRPRVALPSRPATWPANVVSFVSPAVRVSPVAPSWASPLTAELGDIELSEIELEALRLLDAADALTLEQVGVDKEADRRLHIKGVVDSEARRRELAAALRGLPRRRVRLDLVTVEEATRQPSHAFAPIAGALRSAAVIRNRQPAAYENVRRHLVARATTDPAFDLTTSAGVDQGVRQFSSMLLSRSLQARVRARTVQDLVMRVSLADARRLSPGAVATWCSLIRRHAELFRQDTTALRRELDEIFAPSTDVSETFTSAALSRDPWLMADRIFALASAHETAVSRAFAVVAEGTESLEASTSAFRQSLLEATHLANALLSALPDPANP